MSDPYGGMTPIPMHLASVEAGLELGQAATPRRRTYRTVFRTIQLTSDEPAQEIMAASVNRVSAEVQALDDDLTLADKKSDAANGNGATLPKANITPWPIRHNGVVYAGATTFTGGSGKYSRVSVTAVYCDT